MRTHRSHATCEHDGSVQDDAPLVRRVRLMLWAARGWSVPALSPFFGCCCRRTVRRWLHAFLPAGLAELQRRQGPGTKPAGPAPDSAPPPMAPATDGHLVPVVPISVPELWRVLAFHWFHDPVCPDFFWQWSSYRRYKQALAVRSRYKKRGAAPLGPRKGGCSCTSRLKAAWLHFQGSCQ
jgi:Helix-turn-helix domain